MIMNEEGMRSTLFLSIIFLLFAIRHGVLYVCADGEERLTLPLIHKYSVHFQGGLHVNNKSNIEIMKDLHLEDQIRLETVFLPRRKDLDTSTLLMPMHSGFRMKSGLYWVDVHIGTPPQTLVLAADTASDLTWVRCQNGDRDANQNKQKMLLTDREMDIKPKKFDKVFRPDKSSTFKTVACSSIMCKEDLQHMRSNPRDCPTPSSPCRYSYSYLAGLAEGFFGHDTITVPHRRKLQNMTIGCTEVTDKFLRDGGDGVLGLGYSPYSISETVLHYKYAGKFSYCLMNHRKNETAMSYLTFGNNNQTVKKDMIRTKLIMTTIKGIPTYFYGVNVSGISIGGTLLKIPRKFWVSCSFRGGVTVDSGTTNTLLPQPVYGLVMDELKKTVGKFTEFKIEGIPFEFCFHDKGYNKSAVPRLEFHFADGVIFRPPVRNYVVTLDTGVKCLGFVQNDEFIIGNQIMQNFLWEFDIQRGTVGFAVSSCTSN